jgi:hypothetical protein
MRAFKKNQKRRRNKREKKKEYIYNRNQKEKKAETKISIIAPDTLYLLISWSGVRPGWQSQKQL